MAHHTQQHGEKTSGNVTSGGATAMGEDMRECIDACLNCYRVCMDTIQYCLSKGGDHVDPAHMRLLMDCAEICRTSADFMMRGSEMHGKTCGVCAAVCLACAESCAEWADDAVMQRCAEACRSCAESCREMSA